MLRGMFLHRLAPLLLGALYLLSPSAAWSTAAAPGSKPPVFRLDGGDVTYSFGVNETGTLQPLYWGERLSAHDQPGPASSMPDAASFDPSPATTPQEYAGFGGAFYNEPALKVTFPDGTRDVRLQYRANTPQKGGIDVLLKDINLELYVTLHYRMDAATGILARSASIENRTGAPLTIVQAAAASWSLPPDDHYRLAYLTGRWGAEFALERQAVIPGETVLESRRGATSHSVNPWFAIQRGDQGEEQGPVWFGALAWSGSWRITIEQDVLRNVRITGGFNPFDFSYVLGPGEKLDSPIFYGGFSREGLGGASRLLHRFELAQILPSHPSPHLRPVLYNSWEATGFGVDEPGQIALAEKAARIGVERFVVDDGWFGQRKDDHAGLGDWTVNLKKFPHGLKPLIDRVHALGMDFGLWVEPEMVNPDSDLYREHPDWVLNFSGRPRSEARNQLVLNLAMPEVRAYVFGFLDKLLTENQISFLKWDYNRDWAEPGWPAVAPDQQQKIYVDYTKNLYGILADLRAKHPKVEIESCSGGGGRVDLGILALTDEVWTSDNTDPFDRLAIQDGFTHAYTPGTMMAWVTDSPNWVNARSTSLTYRMLSSMQGSLGIGANLTRWTDEDFKTATQLITAYKTIRETVQHGSLYRLISPESVADRESSVRFDPAHSDPEHAATEYVAANREDAVVFAMLHSGQMAYPFPRLYLRGLDPERHYALTSIVGKSAAGTPTAASGSWWMNHGLDIDLRGDFGGAAFRLRAAE